jgi:outer membrane immunogenic protein
MSQRLWTGVARGIVCGVLALVASASLAMADGMPRAPVYGAPVAGSSWQGFYLGAHAGLVTGETTGAITGLTTTDFDLSGALYGVQLGYNLQFGTTVLGIEGSWSDTAVRGNTACVVVFDCKPDMDWVATLVGRGGLVFDRTLVYGMGGLAWADVSTNVSALGTTLLSASETHTGWVAGFGFEHMLSSHITTRIEFAHFDLGSATHNLTSTVGGLTIPDKVDVKMNTIRLGVNIKLAN